MKMVTKENVDLALCIPVFRSMIDDPENGIDDFGKIKRGEPIFPDRPLHRACIEIVQSFSTIQDLQASPLLKERLQEWYIKQHMDLIDASTRYLMYGSMFLAGIVNAEFNMRRFRRSSPVYEIAIQRGVARQPRNDISWMYERLTKEPQLDHDDIFLEQIQREKQDCLLFGLAYYDSYHEVNYPVETPSSALYSAALGKNPMSYLRLRHYFPEFDQSKFTDPEKELVKTLLESKSYEEFVREAGKHEIIIQIRNSELE